MVMPTHRFIHTGDLRAGRCGATDVVTLHVQAGRLTSGDHRLAKNYEKEVWTLGLRFKELLCRTQPHAGW